MPTAARRQTHPLRGWQAAALEQAAREWHGGSFLIAAAPGAGKTRPSIELANRLLTEGEVKRVVLVCPTAPLTRQWAAAAAKLGLHLQPDAETPRPPRDFHGVSVTYARASLAGLKWSRYVGPDTLVIADEAHHLGEDLAWGEGFHAAFGAAKRWLLLSGTPFRSDATAIPGVTYDRDGVAVANVTYSYADAVRDGICRPVNFITYDGTLSWRSGDDVIEAGFETVLTAREASRRYRTAISTELPDGLPRIIKEADARLQKLRTEGGHREAGGLVIAADGEHARKIAKLLREATGKPPVVVLHTEANAPKKLADFAESREPWIVAVNMVSEGVDIPRLRVGVYATAAKTPLIFRQIVGRFVRTIPGRSPEGSWLYLPADPILRDHAANVETELRHVLKRTGVEEEGLLDEVRERKESEKGEVVEWVPLAADVAVESQMSLFGGGGDAAAAPVPKVKPYVPPTPPPPPPGASSDGPDDDAGTGLAAFERRQLLRDRRHRLVSDLRRKTGRSQQDINASVNRAIGVARVEDATIEQLERACSLLLDELTGAKSRNRR